MQSPKVAIVGLGYVGLPLAVALGIALEYPVPGFDINQQRIDELRSGVDVKGEKSITDLRVTKIALTSDAAILGEAALSLLPSGP